MNGPSTTRPTSGPPLKSLTIQAIADQLGIHKSTVSLVLSGKGRISEATRKRILALVEEHGYAPDPFAQRLASRKSHKTVYLCSGTLDPGLGTEKTALLQSHLTELGLDVPISTPAKSNQGDRHDVQSQIEFFRNLRRLRPQAIVCSVYTFHEDSFVELENYQKEGGIVIAYDLPVSLACDQVLFDREDNAYQGARYLLERGHRHLGLGVSQLSTRQHSNLNITQQQRMAGFNRALQEWGVQEPAWIVENARYEEGGAAMAHEFLRLKNRPTGLCIVNDYVALSCMVELMRAGVNVPQEVSLIGHEDQRVAKYCPIQLTSVSQPLPAIIHAVADTLLARLNGDTTPPRTISIRGHLIERESVSSLA